MRKWRAHSVFATCLGMFAAVAMLACGADESQEIAAAEKKSPATEESASNKDEEAKADKGVRARIEGDDRRSGLCAERCLAECTDRNEDFIKLIETGRERTGEAPFQIEIQRAYLIGECHEGAEPARRPDARGISAVVEGSLIYTGDDILYEAELGGALFLVLEDGEYAHSSAGRRGSYSSKQEPQFMRRIRGSDPWFKGEIRGFRWESAPLNPVYCEISPKSAEAFVDIETVGVHGGKKSFALSYLPLAWDEVVGMALEQQVRYVSDKDEEDEPAEAHYSKLDRVLITRLNGSTGWVKRASIISSGTLQKAPGAKFPIVEKSPDWEIQIKGVSDAAEFGGFVPEGEDQSLVVVQVEFKYSPVRDDVLPPTTGSLRNLSARLETSPGKWQRPASKASGQLDTSAEAMPGAKLSGNLVFVTQRFERPFRLELVTPDGATLYLDLFSYDLGPKRGKTK